VWVGVVALLSTACAPADDAESDVLDTSDEPSAICDPAEKDLAPAVVGTIYQDMNSSDASIYTDGFEADIDAALPGVVFSLLGNDEERSFLSCDDGTFATGGLPDGTYLLSPSLADDQSASTQNHPRRLPEAIREGQVTLVTFGDSVPVEGSATLFPARLADLLAPLATTTNHNIAVGGSTAQDWMPGTNLFENTLVPRLDDADVVIISIGGNDVLVYANEAMANGAGIMAAINGLEGFLLELLETVYTLADAIRSRNPNVDIVYCLYPNYATSDTWTSFIGQFKSFIEPLLKDGIELVRSTMDPSKGVVLVDIYGATKDLDLDDYLFDFLHFNDEGQQLYANEIFKALGGIHIEASIPEVHRHFGVVSTTPQTP
tara:strand:+ start:133 stop:1257 length:1125 start_codon:yes stop_codon:yes gene_type:complete